MQVDVHHVETHVAGAANAQHRVEVGAVVIHQGAAAVHELGYLGYLLLKEAERVRVGHHHAGHRVVEQRAQVFNVDYALGRALHLNHVESADSRRGGVGAVCRVGHNHLGALGVAPALVIASYYHQPGELSVCAGKRVEREFGQSGNLRQCPLQSVVHLEGSPACLRRLQRVQVGEAGHGRHLFVDARVVFHCAAAERIEPVVHSEVVFAMVGIMAHNRELVAFGQLGVVAAANVGGHLVVAKLVVRQRIAPSPFV